MTQVAAQFDGYPQDLCRRSVTVMMGDVGEVPPRAPATASSRWGAASGRATDMRRCGVVWNFRATHPEPSPKRGLADVADDGWRANVCSFVCEDSSAHVTVPDACPIRGS